MQSVARVLYPLSLHDALPISGTIVDANGEKELVQAQYLVACDGAKSSVRTRLGLTFEGSTLERLFYVADVQLKDRKSTRLNSSHLVISYAVFCLKKKNKQHRR